MPCGNPSANIKLQTLAELTKSDAEIKEHARQDVKQHLRDYQSPDRSSTERGSSQRPTNLRQSEARKELLETNDSFTARLSAHPLALKERVVSTAILCLSIET